ncbi:MAG TPA: Uma2 family endonuclease [Candidatus Binatia bacterium]|nr:Uma2 family endonuclease [Candidatus Binatia bacterium]
MAAGVATQPKRWTYEDYYALPDDQRYEVIDGELLPMVPSPESDHQKFSRALFRRLDSYVASTKLGELLYAPLDVILNDENIVQPDLVFVRADRVAILERRGIVGAPDLVIEILSPFSVRRDRQRKMRLYAQFGVKEFWIVDPGNHGIEVFTLKSGAYELQCKGSERGKIRSNVLGLEFDVAEVIEQL